MGRDPLRNLKTMAAILGSMSKKTGLEGVQEPFYSLKEEGFFEYLRIDIVLEGLKCFILASLRLQRWLRTLRVVLKTMVYRNLRI